MESTPGCSKGKMGQAHQRRFDCHCRQARRSGGQDSGAVRHHERGSGTTGQRLENAIRTSRGDQTKSELAAFAFAPESASVQNWVVPQFEALPKLENWRHLLRGFTGTTSTIP